jgi:hypothetical protein
MLHGFDPRQERHGDRTATKVSERLRQPVARYKPAASSDSCPEDKRVRPKGSASAAHNPVGGGADYRREDQAYAVGRSLELDQLKRSKPMFKKGKRGPQRSMGCGGQHPGWAQNPWHSLGFYMRWPRCVPSRYQLPQFLAHSSKSASACCSRLRTASLVCAKPFLNTIGDYVAADNVCGVLRALFAA